MFFGTYLWGEAREGSVWMKSKKNQNGLMLQGFEWYLPCDHTLWKRLGSLAGTLSDYGITAIWLPPATKGAFGDQGTGYAMYDLYDLGEFDQKGSVPTKYGTRAEYLACIRALQKAGIQVYADIVLDHMIGADEEETIEATEVSSGNRTLPVSGTEQIRAWTKFTFPGRHGKYSDFVFDSSCFDGVDWDDKKKKNAIFLFQNHAWDGDVDAENGNYDYLMGADLDFSSKKLVRHLYDWGRWYLDTTGVDGFRLDAVKHIPADFYRDFLPAMRKYSGKELFTVGEYWSADLGSLTHYLSLVNEDMSLFDVPLHFAFYNASNDGYHYDMRHLFDGTLVMSDPVHAVTFIDNHDTQVGQALGSWVRDWFRPLAYACILLKSAGYPCVFYGDLFGIPHAGFDGVAELPMLMALRQTFAFGPEEDFAASEHIVGFTRPETGLAVALSAHESGSLHMHVDPSFAGKRFADALGKVKECVTIGADGFADFPVQDGSVSCYVPEDQIPKTGGLLS